MMTSQITGEAAVGSDQEVEVDDPHLAVVCGREAGTLTAHLVGDLDLSVTDLLQCEVLAAVSPSVRHVHLDLHDLAFCDSSGIAAFVTLHQLLRSEGRTLSLVAPGPTVHATLCATRIDTLIRVVPSTLAYA